MTITGEKAVCWWAASALRLRWTMTQEVEIQVATFISTLIGLMALLLNLSNSLWMLVPAEDYSALRASPLGNRPSDVGSR
jgi:hypothetical protein